jgi:hypothetical protein
VVGQIGMLAHFKVYQERYKLDYSIGGIEVLSALIHLVQGRLVGSKLKIKNQ